MSDGNYTAADMEQLEGLEVIRKRPGMYIGGTDSDALMHLLWEAMDNAVDEHLVGYGKKITVTLHEDGKTQVDDEARGIPCDVNSKTGKTGLEMAFGLHSGGKFNQNAYAAAGGLHGVGIAAVAAVSSRLTAIVYRNGKEHVIEFRKGVQGVFKGEGPDAEFTPQTGISKRKDSRSAAEKKQRPTGTTIMWYPDYTVFDNDTVSGDVARLEVARVLERAKNTCYLCPELTIVVKDDKYTHSEHSFNFPDGFKDMLENMSKTEFIADPIAISGEATFVTRGVEKTLHAEVLLRWEKGFENHTASFVNIIETTSGGTHVTGTQKGIEEAVVFALEEKSMLKSKDPVPELVDISEGLNLIVSIKMPEPDYGSQTKERLKETGPNAAMRRIVSENLKAWFAARKNSAQGKEILEKIIAAARSRKAKNAQFDVNDVMADVSKMPVFSRKPEKLKECKEVGSPRSELMIVEGESALGTLLGARSAKYQAIFPLKGKPLNVFGLSPERLFIPPNIKSPRTPVEKRKESQRKKFLDAGHLLLQNKELDDLVKVIGAGFGDNFEVDKMRYHRICLVADADVDGGHIETLLIGFFSIYMPQLIEQGRLFMACPPLFVVKAGKESNPDILLASNDQELEVLLTKARKEGKKIIQVARRKGHGESSAEEAFEYIMNPSTRKVKQITIEDSKKAQAMLELTLGGDASLRKEWIMNPKTRTLVSIEELD